MSSRVLALFPHVPRNTLRDAHEGDSEAKSRAYANRAYDIAPQRRAEAGHRLVDMLRRMLGTGAR